MDQRMAFQWIIKNIAAFGGDPSQVPSLSSIFALTHSLSHFKITAFGQSAGATSIAVHLISPKSKGLFTKAIIESNPVQLPMKYLYLNLYFLFNGSFNYITKIRKFNDAAGQGANFLQYLGCSDDMACLQSKSPAEIVAAQVKVRAKSLIHNTHAHLPSPPSKGGSNN